MHGSPDGTPVLSLQGKIFSAMPPAQQPDEKVFMSLQQYSAKPEKKKKVSTRRCRAAAVACCCQCVHVTVCTGTHGTVPHVRLTP